MQAEQAIPSDEVEISSEELLAEVAHDLRGYLAVINAYAQLLEAESLLNPEARRDASRRIKRSCSLMTELLETCLQLESATLRTELVDPVAVLSECISFHASAAQAKSIQLISRFSILPQLSLDEGSLRRIVSNLLANAIKFTPHGSQIATTAHLSEGSLAIAVEDEGPGFSPQEIPSVFDRGRKGAAASTGGEQGHGLGLAIVRRLVHACRGMLTVRTRPGKGTTFTVMLPDLRIAG